MSLVTKHLEEEFDQADKAYWEAEERLSEYSKELIELNRIVDSLMEEKKALDEKRKYFQNLLNEIRN
jgi:chromosome segregation ATPase